MVKEIKKKKHSTIKNPKVVIKKEGKGLKGKTTKKLKSQSKKSTEHRSQTKAQSSNRPLGLLDVGAIHELPVRSQKSEVRKKSKIPNPKFKNKSQIKVQSAISNQQSIIKSHEPLSLKSKEIPIPVEKENIEELNNLISLENIATFFSKEEVKKMLGEYAKTKDKELREKLILMHIGLVHNIAKKFTQKGEPLRDIFQVGYVGLIQAFDRFDFNRGVEFITFATPTIIGEIKRYFRDKGWKIRIPRRIQELNLAIFRALSELTQSLNHAPTVKEIAIALKTTEEEVLEAMELGQAYNPISLNAKIAGDEDDYPETLMDITGSVDAEIENLINKDALKKALSVLNKVEKVIIYWRFYKNLTQYEIAKRLKMSQMQISRMQNRALHKIRNFIEGKEIADEEY